MVKGFVLPESLSRSAQDQVGLSPARTFQPACDLWEGGLGPNYYMHVVGHDHPGPELIEMPSALAIQESLSYHPRYSGVLQPDRPDSGFVRFAVNAKKARPGERGAPADGCGSRVRGMESANRQVTNRKAASAV